MYNSKLKFAFFIVLSMFLAIDMVQAQNLIKNGSFEMGLHPWLARKYATRYLTEDNFQCVTGGCDGRYALNNRAKDDPAYMKRGVSLCSSWVTVKKDGQYRLSLAVKNDSDKDARLDLCVYSCGTTGFSKEPFVRHRIKVKASQPWTVVTRDFRMPPKQTIPKMYVSIEFPAADVSLLVDSVSMVALPVSEDENRAQPNAGAYWVSEKQANIFFLKDKLNIKLKAFNHDNKARNIAVSMNVVDSFEKLLLEKTFKFMLKSDADEDIEVALPKKLGKYTISIESKDLGTGESFESYRDTLSVSRNVAPLLNKISDEDFFFGMNIHANRFSDKVLDRQTQLLNALGFRWGRLWWSWGTIVKTEKDLAEKKADFTETDRQVNIMHKNKMAVMACLDEYYVGSWLTEARSEIPKRKHGPEYYSENLGKEIFFFDKKFFRDNFAKIALLVVEHYYPRIKAFEFINEDQFDFSDIGFARFCEKTYKTVKPKFPGATLVYGGASLTKGAWLSYDYTLNHIKAGSAPYMDVLSVHSYGRVGAFEISGGAEIIDETKELLRKKRNGKDIAIWDTEVGISSDGDGYGAGIDDATLASGYIKHVIAELACEIARNFWFASDYFLGYRLTVFGRDMRLRTILIANAELSARTMGGSIKPELIKDKSLDGVLVYRWEADNKSMFLIYAALNPQNRTLVFSQKNLPYTTYDMLGNRTRQAKTDELKIEATPIYLEISSEKGDALEKAIVTATQEHKRSTDSEEFGKIIVINNYMDKNMLPNRQGPFNVDAQGFIKDWLVFGSFANLGDRYAETGRDHNYLSGLGDNSEGETVLHAGQEFLYTLPDGKAAKLLWGDKAGSDATVKCIKAVADEKGVLKLLPLFEPNVQAVTYAQAVIVSPADQKVTMALGSDDGVKVWLNGSLVHSIQDYRGTIADTDKFNVNLKKGENRLLVKISQFEGGWGLCVRLYKDGKILRNIKIRN